MSKSLDFKGEIIVLPLPTVITFMVKAITTYWGLRIKLVRLFQERLSEIGMGRFIAHYTRSQGVKRGLERWIRGIVNAYIFVISPCALLSVYGDEIRRTPFLDDYFSQWDSYLIWKGQKDAIGEKTIPVINEANVMADVFRVYKKPELTNRLHECVGNRSKVGELVIGSIMDTVESKGYDSAKTVDYINQNVQTYDFTPYLGLLAPLFWRVVHPTLDLDWTVIKSYIVLYKTYSEHRLFQEFKELVPAFIKDQMVRVEVDDKPFQYKPLDVDGYLRVEIPRSLVERKITLNSFGLKYDVTPWEICGFIPSKPQDIFLLSGVQWGRVKELLKNRTMLVVPFDIGGLASEEMQGLLESYILKVNMLFDQELDYGFNPVTFKDIFYQNLDQWGYRQYQTNIIIPCIEQGFGLKKLPIFWDYQLSKYNKLEDVINFTGGSGLYDHGYGYREVGESFLIEAPFDGIWMDLKTLDKWISWLPCTRLIWMAKAGSDPYHKHEYPSAWATLQAYASKWNIPLHMG